ncbi:unnamed protein product, partial [Ectocarpus sp. 8 AP-2014]
VVIVVVGCFRFRFFFSACAVYSFQLKSGEIRGSIHNQQPSAVDFQALARELMAATDCSLSTRSARLFIPCHFHTICAVADPCPGLHSFDVCVRFSSANTSWPTSRGGTRASSNSRRYPT